jgi:selenocysteine lyase/cysteine desulfurase
MNIVRALGVLTTMKHVRLQTPMDESLSSGIVCFDVVGMSPEKAVATLADKGVIAGRTPYRTQFARLCPGLPQQAKASHPAISTKLVFADHMSRAVAVRLEQMQRDEKSKERPS